MQHKVYLDAQQFLHDCFRLGAMVLQSGFDPTVVVGIWRGGVPVAAAVQELLRCYGCRCQDFVIKTSAYHGIDNRSNRVDVYAIQELAQQLSSEDRVLIVDDVFDTGVTAQAVIKELNDLAGQDAPGAVRIAVPYFKPDRNQTSIEPDYFLHQTNAWLKFPHSLEGLSGNEIREHRAKLAEVLASAR